MGLSWQQGPLAPGATGPFLTPDPLPEVIPHGSPDRYFEPDEALPRGRS